MNVEDLLFGNEIPHRDYVSCQIGLILILLLASFESTSTRKRLDSKRFRRVFVTLSTFEVIFTIVIPWLAILEGLLNRDSEEMRRNGHLLAAHLYIFQAQIAGECIIAMAGEHRRWLVFPFTCAANAYRGVTLITWIVRVLEEEALEARDVILPALATLLWLYSSFIFIPKLWYPLLKK